MRTIFLSFILAPATVLFLFCAPPGYAAQIEEGLSCSETSETFEAEVQEVIAQTNVLITRIETAYNEARKGLTDQQRAYLDQLVAENRAIAMIDSDVIAISSGILNCASPGAAPTLDGPYSDALQRLSSIKDKEKRERNKLHFQREHEATFIDERILREYLQVQLLKVSSEIAEATIAGASLMGCEEAKARLAEYHLLPGGISVPDAPAK